MANENPNLVTDDGAGFWTRLKMSFADKPKEIAAILKKAFPGKTVGQIERGKYKGEWAIQEGDKWKLVDEEGFSMSDIADMAGPSLPIVGSMAGEVLGAGVGTVAGAPTGPGVILPATKGAIAGGALGAGAGEAARKGIKGFMVPSETTLGEDVVDIGKETAFGGAGTAAGIGMAKGAKALLAPNVPDDFSRGLAAKKADYLRSMKFEPTPADVSEKGPVTVLDYSLENLLGSSGRMQAAYRKNVNRLIAKQAQLAKRIGGSRNPVKAGEELQMAARERFREIFADGGEASQRFDAVGKAAKGIDIDLTNFRTTLQEIKDSALYKTTPNKEFTKKVDELESLVENVYSLNFGESAEEGVRLLRAFTRDFADSPELVTGRYKGKFKHLVSQLDKDIETTLKKVDPILYDEYRTTNAWYAEQKGFWNSRIGKALVADYQLAQPGAKSPEDLAKLIINPNKATTIRQVRKQLGDPAFKEVQRVFLTNMFESAGVEADKYGTIKVLHPKKLSDFVHKYGSDTITAIFEDSVGSQKGDLLNRFRSMVRSTKYVKRSIEGATAPERLGQVLLTGQAIQNVGGAAVKAGQIAMTGGMAAGKQPAGKLATVIGMLGIPYVISKAFLGAPGMKWVTTGLLGQGTKVGNRAVRGLTHLGVQTGLSTLGRRSNE